jgi:hypothetical protein
MMMIRPAKFGFNPETADSNGFQHKPSMYLMIRMTFTVRMPFFPITGFLFIKAEK